MRLRQNALLNSTKKIIKNSKRTCFFFYRVAGRGLDIAEGQVRNVLVAIQPGDEDLLVVGPGHSREVVVPVECFFSKKKRTVMSDVDHQLGFPKYSAEVQVDCTCECYRPFDMATGTEPVFFSQPMSETKRWFVSTHWQLVEWTIEKIPQFTHQGTVPPQPNSQMSFCNGNVFFS